MRINATLGSVQSAKPNKAFGQLASMPFKSSEKAGVLRVSIPADIPDDAIITKADLVFHVLDAWSGAVVWTARRHSDPWSLSKVTWNNRPGITGTARTTTVTSPSAGDVFRVDVSADVQSFVSGSATNRGFRISTDNTSGSRTIYGATAAKRKPYLDLEYVVPPDAPTALVPDGPAVSIAKPTLTFAVPDDTIAIQVQIDGNADGVSVTFDSGEVPEVTGILDLAGTAYGGISDGATTYWRARAKSPLGWSAYSEWATLRRVSKPTVTITSPGATTGDVTPPITWTAPGQAVWKARLLKADGTVLDDSDLTASSDLEWVPAKGLKRVGQSGRAHVRVIDDEDRVATPGDPIWSEAYLDFTVVAIDTAPGADDIAVTQDGPSPVMKIVIDGPTPDLWRITRDGDVLDTIDGSVTEFLDYTAPPFTQHTYQALAATDTGLVSPNGPQATVQPRPAGVWLIDPDTDERVMILDADVTIDMSERAVLHAPLGDGAPIRRRSGTPPPSGTVSGSLVDVNAGDAYDPTVMAETATGFKFKRQGNVYRLSWGTSNLPVTIGDLLVAPVATEDGSTKFTIAFSWWQTNDEWGD